MRRESITALSLVTLIMLSLLSWIPSALAAVPESEWWMYRPSEHVYVNQHVENASTNDEASVGIGIFITEYQENSNSWPFAPERDGLIFRVAATANTRKGITYNHYTANSLADWFDLSSLGSEYIVTTDDDGGRWIDLPPSLAVRFYGGPGYHSSAEYEKLWVCSNGFLSFDSESNSSDPQPIPNPDSPNAMLAVYWSDLDPSGGWIKYYINEPLGLFVVEWYNVLDKNNGIRQTFEVIIWNTWNPYLGQRGQNRFAFLYQSVTWDDNAVAGIEDQEGYKGIWTGGLSGQSIYFHVEKESAEIRRLKISLEKSDGQAEIWILEDPKVLKGVNFQLSGEDPAPPWFEDALGDLVTLLASIALAETIGAPAGLIFEGFVIGLEFVEGYVQEFSPFKYEAPDVKDASITENEAHVYAKAEGGWGWPVDATFGSQIYWVFTDNNTEDHSIKITATLEYCYYNTNHEIFTEEISTSVNLNVEIGRTLTISAGSGGTTDPAPGPYTYSYGESVTVTASTYSGYAFTHWVLDGETTYGNPITVTMNSDHTLRACFQYNGGGGSGCPILSVYSGTGYVEEGLLDIHNPDGIDQITSHVLIHTPEPVEHRYLLRLTEHPQTYSHLDQVRLFAMLTNGTEVKLSLVSAIHSEDGNVKQELLVSDDVRAVMLGEDWNNGTSQYIDLKFIAPDELEIETFTFIIEGHNVPEKESW